MPIPARKVLLGILLFAIGAACAPAWGATLELTGDESRQYRPDIYYLMDPGGDMTLDQVRQQPGGAFTAAGAGGLALSFTHAAVWLRFDVVDRADANANWLLQINDALLDDIDVYQEVAPGKWTRKHLGDQGQRAVDAVDSISPVLPVTFTPNQTTRFYLRIQSDSSLLLDVRLLSARQFFQSSMVSFLSYGAMYGIVLAMCVYNLFLFFSLRDFNYLLYVVSMLSTALFLASLSGHAPRWLWPNHTAWTEEIYQAICAVVLVSGLWFADRFLEAADRVPRMHRVIRVLIVMAVLTVPFSLATNFQLSIHLTGLVSAAAGAAGIITALLSMLNGHRPARYYLLAWSGYCLGAIMMAGRQHGLLPNNFLTTHAMELGSVLETVLISFALSDRYNQLRQAKEDAQREAADNLRRMDLLKDEFLANTSHELRTPLQGIIGLAESMLDGAAGKVGEAAAMNLAMIVSSGRRLASLVDDILDFSKMKNQDLRLKKQSVDLHVAVDVVMRLSAPMAQAKSLDLINDINSDVPTVLADEARLQQILYNLIGNAIKFTDVGSVRVAAIDEGETVRIQVMDTGPGIAPENQERIFHSFEQLEGADTRAHGGTGLGLAVTRDLINLHGGTIGVDSRPGKGATFHFTLPCAATQAAADTEPEQISTMVSSLQASRPTSELVSPADLQAFSEPVGVSIARMPERARLGQRIRILVVDDEPINQMVMLNHLLLEDYETVQAENGMKALELLQNGQEFDLVLLDVMMPKLSGFEVCREIRKTFLPTQLPIVMVTARTQLQDLTFGLQVGANDYITKPVAKGELLARIKTHLTLMRINSAYSCYVPHEFLRYLKRDNILDVKLGDNVEMEAAVFISDIRGFATLSETMDPDQNFDFINRYLAAASPPIRENYGFIDRYSGDSIMAVFPGGADHALLAARGTLHNLQQLNLERQECGEEAIQIGIGIHLGLLRLGIVGEEQRRQGDIFADTVNVANRIEGMTKTYGSPVIVSEAFVSALADPERVLPLRRNLGDVFVKGRNTAVTLYECFEFDRADLVRHKLRTRDTFQAAQAHFQARRYTQAVDLLVEVMAANGDDAAARYLHAEAVARLHN